MSRQAGSAAADEAAPFYDRTLVRRLGRFVRPHRGLLIGALLLLPVDAALQLLPPYLLKLAIDVAIVPGVLAALLPYAAALVGVLLAQQLAAYGQYLLMQICGQRAMRDLRAAVHRHVLGLRTAFFDRTPVGWVMTRVTNDVEHIAEAFASGLLSVLADALILCGIVVAMLLLDARLALLTLAVLPALLLVVTVAQRALRQAYRTIQQRLSRINATLQEQINGIKVVQAFGAEARSARDFDEANREFRDAYRRAIKFDSSLFALVEMLGSLTIALLIWYGGGKVVAGGAVTFGLLVAFIEYVRRFFRPIRDLSAKLAVMQQAMAAAERVFGLLDTREPDAARQADAAGPAPDADECAVCFEEVSFAYRDDEPVLDHVSFTVRRGETVALVGPSGAGKSTVARLLVRLYERDRGTIRLAGQDVRALAAGDLRRRVVLLGQDVFLFAGSVLSNITLDDPAISAAAANAAAARVGLDRVLPMDHSVGERGANLSAGERQLVVFARALARDPEVLVLDEATASVDPESERIIEQGIAELMRERTAIVVAHRLTTIERADRVLVLAGGRVVEEGRHAELLDRGGLYARLHELQYVAPPTRE